MTPEQQQQLKELYDWMQDRKRQQISYPLDEASKNAMGVPIKVGAGSHALTQTVTDSHGDTSTVPAAYSGSIVLLIDGEQVEIGRLS